MVASTVFSPGDTEIKNQIAVESEIIPDRLYLVVFKNELIPSNTKSTHYFCIDNVLVYQHFFNDFGPLDIRQLYQYCQTLNRKISRYKGVMKIIVHYTTMDAAKRVNSAFLIGAYSIIYLNKTPKQAFEPLDYGPPYVGFCDVYGKDSSVSLMDCLQAVFNARNVGFFDFNDFDADEYDYYDRIEHANLHWIVPNKFIAFAGPANRAKIKNNYPIHAPQTYFNYFRQSNIRVIIRLNGKHYDASTFLKAGFEHRDMYFNDGTEPSDGILMEFLQICESTDGSIAVHCRAGLGRTGCLIAAYIMKHYHFTAREAIAWLRLCRPGSVSDLQQHWLEKKQHQQWMEHEQLYGGKVCTNARRHQFGIYSLSNINLPSKTNDTNLAS